MLARARRSARGLPAPVGLLLVGLYVGLGGLAGGAGCMVDYGDDTIPGLTDAPEPSAEAELVFERQLRWWAAPTLQRVRLYRGEGGEWLLLREGWQGLEVYGWARGTATAAGATALADALAAADASDPAPAPGDVDCRWVESLPATIWVDDEAIEFLGLCPPAGLAELVEVYAQITDALLDCPLDPVWPGWTGEPLVEQTDCDAI